MLIMKRTRTGSGGEVTLVHEDVFGAIHGGHKAEALVWAEPLAHGADTAVG